MESSPAVLIYDAGCPVCRKTADWVRRNAAGPGAFELLPCRSDETRRRFPAIRESDCLAAIHIVLPGGKALAGERALPEILRRLRRYRPAAALFRLPGAFFLSRVLYRRFAAHRIRISAAMGKGGR
jgi:predicted DCC family thiol-disulfide oxidoreductase YuxK